MAYEIITIPFNENTRCFHADELNKFCLNKRVVSMKAEFFRDEQHKYWTVFIEYETILESTGSEPKGLTEAGRICYEELRKWRRETAEKEGIPPYVICRNSQLGEIVKKEIKTLEGLKQVDGFGDKKTQKYGKDIIAIINTFYAANDEG